MANQHTRAKAEQEAAAAAAAAADQGMPVITDDGPDVGPTPDDVARQAAALADELEATQAELEAARAALAARPRAGSTVVVNNPPATAGRVPPPSEPTYEPGEVDDDGVAYAATIIAHGPNGEQTECTPKVFRTILAAKGYTAHPLDAAQHLGNEPTRSRRRQRANVDGANPEQVTAARRRRRAAPAAE